MIIFSVDYEFSGDGSGDFFHDLCAKTDILLKVLQDVSLKANFFIEVEEIVALKRSGLHGIYTQVLKQIEAMFEQGHGLHLHIHPQFSEARYINGSWKVDMTKTSFQKEILDHVDAAELFSTSMLKWYNIIEDAGLPRIAPRAFRAGGYNVNNLDQCAKILSVHGIKVESSVLPGVKSKNSYTNIDHRGYSTEPWRINNDITEFPITTLRQRYLERMTNFKYLYDKLINKNVSHATKSVKPNSKGFINLIMSKEISPVDFVLSSRKTLRTAKQIFTETGYLHMIGHNKSVYSKKKLIENLRIFAEYNGELL